MDAPWTDHVLDFTFEVISFCMALDLSAETDIKFTYVMGGNFIKTMFPTYSGLPSGCLMDMRYTVEVVGKTVHPGFIGHPVYSLPADGIPTFLKWDIETDFTIQGNNFDEVWNTYLFRVNATDIQGP